MTFIRKKKKKKKKSHSKKLIYYNEKYQCIFCFQMSEMLHVVGRDICKLW